MHAIHRWQAGIRPHCFYLLDMRIFEWLLMDWKLLLGKSLNHPAKPTRRVADAAGTLPKNRRPPPRRTPAARCTQPIQFGLEESSKKEGLHSRQQGFIFIVAAAATECLFRGGVQETNLHRTEADPTHNAHHGFFVVFRETLGVVEFGKVARQIECREREKPKECHGRSEHLRD